MSDIVDRAVEKLNARLDGGFDGSAKFEIDGEGSIIVDAEGARAGDEETDVTLSADTETFVEILDGSLNPTSAFMSGRLRVEGDMGQAMKLGAALG